MSEPAPPPAIETVQRDDDRRRVNAIYAGRRLADELKSGGDRNWFQLMTPRCGGPRRGGSGTCRDKLGLIVYKTPLGPFLYGHPLDPRSIKRVMHAAAIEQVGWSEGDPPFGVETYSGSTGDAQLDELVEHHSAVTFLVDFKDAGEVWQNDFEINAACHRSSHRYVITAGWLREQIAAGNARPSPPLTC